MQLVWHYLKLYSELKERSGSEPIAIGLPDLAGMLYCTERNVKLIIRKMSEAGWVEWIPGRGRGITSRLSFLKPVDEVVLQEAKAIAEKGRLAEALDMMRISEMGEAERERFLRWLSGYFGHSVEQDEKRETDVLRLPIYKTVATLDPAFVFYAIDCYLVKQIYDPLFFYDREKKKVVPHLAYAWVSDEEHRVWTIRLRKGVRFHHGEEMTAGHVKASFERLRRIGSPHSWLMDKVLSIDVEGRYKIRFELASPNRLFPDFLCSSALSVVCQLEGSSVTGEDHLVGTGPFRLAKRDEHIIVLEANASYFRERAHLDRVDLWLLPESVEPVVSGSADTPIFFNHRAPIKQADTESDNVEIHTIELGCSMLTFNLKKQGGLQHPKLREAIDIGLDRMRMAAELGENRVGPAYGFVNGPAPNDRTLIEPALHAEERLELAKSLVAASGYNGESLKLYVYPKHADDAYWVSSRCHEFGVNVEVAVFSLIEMMDGQRILESDLILYELVMDESEQIAAIEFYQMPTSFLRAHMEEGLMQAVDREIEDLLKLENGAERMQNLKEIENRLRQERQILFLLRKSLSMAHDTMVKGASFNSLGWVDLQGIWFE